MLPRPLVTILTVLIAIAWAANVVVGFISPERHDPTLNAIFGIVVGGVFALKRPDRATLPRVRAELARWIAGDNSARTDEPDDAEADADADPAQHTEHTPGSAE